MQTKVDISKPMLLEMERLNNVSHTFILHKDFVYSDIRRMKINYISTYKSYVPIVCR